MSGKNKQSFLKIIRNRLIIILFITCFVVALAAAGVDYEEIKSKLGSIIILIAIALIVAKISKKKPADSSKADNTSISVTSAASPSDLPYSRAAQAYRAKIAARASGKSVEENSFSKIVQTALQDAKNEEEEDDCDFGEENHGYSHDYTRRMQQLRGFLKNGTIDKAEYEVLVKKYTQYSMEDEE